MNDEVAVANEMVIDEMVIDDVETIKVFADERRLQILERMREPTTVKIIAQALDTPPTKLYYHVNMLHQHGLIQVVGQNLESGIVEKIYQVTARRYRLINPLIAGERYSDEAAAAIFGSLLADTRREFLTALSQRDPAEDTPPRHPFLSKKEFRLTDAQLTALHSKLDALIREVTALGEENLESGEAAFGLTVAFYRMDVD
ncbi:MAG: helix-turn-helix domain-containing protein [Caldilineaceae bacterium]